MTVTNPWFWAFLSATGWALAFGIIGSQTLGRQSWFATPVFLLVEVPRVLLPLPFVSQPRIPGNATAFTVVGAVVLAASLVFAGPVLRIVALTAPSEQEPLRTGGLYAIVRHPLMVCDVFWPLGVSLIFQSVIGAVLTVAWLAIIWVLTEIEEQAMVREYGDAYRSFQAQVPRLIPRLPGMTRDPNR